MCYVCIYGAAVARSWNRCPVRLRTPGWHSLRPFPGAAGPLRGRAEADEEAPRGF